MGDIEYLDLVDENNIILEEKWGREILL
jgi:hypothetical protein